MKSYFFCRDNCEILKPFAGRLKLKPFTELLLTVGIDLNSLLKPLSM